MTDKEMAEEYIKKNNLEWELECNRTSPIGEVKQAFLAGLKAGRPKWHKVADGDFPKDNKKVLVLLKDVEEPILDYYRQDGLWNYALENEVIAWCEIPKFKEEVE